MKTLQTCELVNRTPVPQREALYALCAMQRGETGCICSLEADPSEARRLAEMGLVEGAVIRMIRPGRTCIVGVDRSRLSLGRRLQREVMLSVTVP